jgi:hypothetical protein
MSHEIAILASVRTTARASNRENGVEVVGRDLLPIDEIIRKVIVLDFAYGENKFVTLVER